jgi:hypothetical protein
VLYTFLCGKKYAYFKSLSITIKILLNYFPVNGSLDLGKSVMWLNIIVY